MDFLPSFFSVRLFVGLLKYSKCKDNPSTVYIEMRGFCGLLIELFQPLVHRRPILDLYDCLIVRISIKPEVLILFMSLRSSELKFSDLKNSINLGLPLKA